MSCRPLTIPGILPLVKLVPLSYIDYLGTIILFFSCCVALPTLIGITGPRTSQIRQQFCTDHRFTGTLILLIRLACIDIAVIAIYLSPQAVLRCAVYDDIDIVLIAVGVDLGD
jgi:hypothetical protein